MFQRHNEKADAVNITRRVARGCSAALHTGVVVTLLGSSLAGCEVGERGASGAVEPRLTAPEPFAPSQESAATTAAECEEPEDEPVELDGPTEPSESSNAGCIDREIAALVDLPRLTGVKIDGDPAEWAEVAVAAYGSRERKETMKLAVDCEHLYVLVQGPKLTDRTQLLLDADGDPATGEPLPLGEWAGSGADYLVSNDWFASHVTVPFGWNDMPGIGVAKRGASEEDSVMEYRISFKTLGGFIPPRFGLVFRNMVLPDGGPEELVSRIPEQGMWRVPPRYESRGMIVPAYFPPEEAKAWSALNDAAAVMSGSGHDFWVAISGTNSGPHDLTPDRMERWHAAQESGAELFAYVGTCKHVAKSKEQTTEASEPEAHGCDGLRPHCEVMADVLAWRSAVEAWNAEPANLQTKDGGVRAPLKLSGIWIDEFYPKQEVSARGGAVIEDRSGQIVPTNGYYHKLTEAMRRLDRDWKLIGNAGGRLETNQLNYGKLVDVVCSFEDKLGHTDSWSEGKHKGPGLQIQLVHPRYGQLALVHETPEPSDMEALVQRVFQEGYSHVYATDVPHSKPDGSVNALWNIAPRYLVDQARAVKAGLASGWKPKVRWPSAP